MTQPDKDLAERHERRTEIIAVSVLSVAALCSSYAGFQAELWDGELAANYALAEQTRTGASKDTTVALQLGTVDALIFTQWLNASAENNAELQQFYRDRFRPKFRGTFEQWLALRPRQNPKAPPSPFLMPGYRDSELQAGRDQSTKADQLFAAGQKANEISDAYGQSVVIFALSLFMGGIMQGFDIYRTRVLILVLSSFSLVLGILRIVGLPAIRLW